MPLIDETVLTEYQNDIGLEKARALLKIVISEMEMRSGNALKAHESGDSDEMEREFHTVKSICFMVGATDMANLAMEIEVGAANMSQDELEQKLSSYTDIKRKTIAQLNQRMAS